MFWSIWTQSHGLAQLDKQPREQEQGTGCGGSSWAGSPTTAFTRFLSPAEAPQVPKPPLEAPDPPSRPLPPQSLEGLQPAGPETGGLERAPIQSSPWKETSLDHPYEKPRKSSEAGSESRSGRREGEGGHWLAQCLLPGWLCNQVHFSNAPSLSLCNWEVPNTK